MSDLRIEKIRRIADEARSFFWRTENWRVEPYPDPDEDEDATRIVYDKRSDTNPPEKLWPCLDERYSQQIICNLMNEMTTIVHLMDKMQRYERIMLEARKYLSDRSDQNGVSELIISNIDSALQPPPF